MDSFRLYVVYTCGGQNGSIPVKHSQGEGYYEKNSCMVIEMEGVIDGQSSSPYLVVDVHSGILHVCGLT
jgi:hypothetical protein